MPPTAGTEGRPTLYQSLSWSKRQETRHRRTTEGPSGHSRRVLSDQGGHGMAERSWNQSVRTSLKGSSEDCYRRLSTGTGPSSRPSANSEDSHLGWLGWHHSEKRPTV